MHNLALELAHNGDRVTGSDDEIRDPARSRLDAAGILPEAEGWFPEKITPDLDLVVLGMHARPDNPELKRAQELKLPVVSFPEYVRRKSTHKHRIVIAGSHGKTTITAMILHVLHQLKYDVDYLLGSSLPGFERMVRITHQAPTILIEGDEYHTSPLDPRPKFLHYDPHTVVVSGIAWDHINVFPTEDSYIAAFHDLLANMKKAGVIIYNKEDRILRGLAHALLKKEHFYPVPYQALPYRVRNEEAQVRLQGQTVRLQVFGRHNSSNISAAWEVCSRMGVSLQEFIQHISTFAGTALRLETVADDGHTRIIRDFAHAPSKVKASVAAVTGLFPHRHLVACFELHTFSSLNKAFLSQYRGALKAVRNKIVYVDRNVLAHKQLPPITREDVIKGFRDRNIKFADTREGLLELLHAFKKEKTVYLMMSSGAFSGIDFRSLLG